MSENWRLFVMVGLCGGYTTFSAFSLQTLDLMRGGLGPGGHKRRGLGRSMRCRSCDWACCWRMINTGGDARCANGIGRGRLAPPFPRPHAQARCIAAAQPHRGDALEIETPGYPFSRRRRPDTHQDALRAAPRLCDKRRPCWRPTGATKEAIRCGGHSPASRSERPQLSSPGATRQDLKRRVPQPQPFELAHIIGLPAGGGSAFLRFVRGKTPNTGLSARYPVNVNGIRSRAR